MLAQPLGVDRYPPGLYVGLAGIARAFAWFGHHDRADDALRLAYTSPLLFDEVGISHGIAGWGLASLSAYAETGNATHLDHAVRGGERLLEVAIADAEGGRHWTSPSDGQTYIGYAHGTSGIAGFLLNLSIATGDPRFRSAAIDGIEFTLRHAYGDDRKLQWFSHVGGRVVYPYWRHGTAGVATSLLRFYDALRDERYLSAARRAAAGLRMLFSSFPGQFDGMSGVGEFLLDMYDITGEGHYHRMAVELAEGVLCFRVETDGGVSFPGRALLRLSTDHAFGSAGTGAFLQRILTPTLPSLDRRLSGAL
jgi:lantibiotic modifying enzyme